MPELPKISTVAILLHIAGNETEGNYGLAISKATGYPSGTVVPALKRLSERDNLLTRAEVPTRTGRPRVVHCLNDNGRKAVQGLLDDIGPRIETLAKVETRGSSEGKVNLSTVWILSAAVASGGRIFGYDDRLRPLTHQAAYVELDRLVDLGWFELTEQGQVLTEAGRNAAAVVGQAWLPIIEAARRRL